MPSPTADSRLAKLQNSYRNLTTASNNLNTASDKLGEAVSSLDEAINTLSPGVTAWITISSGTPDDEPWMSYEERLGFAKTNNRWGLSLSKVDVDKQENEENTTDVWLFNDAPRNLRLRAIDYVPDLMEALADEAQRTAQKVTESADIAIRLLHSLNASKGKQQ
jgi:hypothetical protein